MAPSQPPTRLPLQRPLQRAGIPQSGRQLCTRGGVGHWNWGHMWNRVGHAWKPPRRKPPSDYYLPKIISLCVYSFCTGGVKEGFACGFQTNPAERPGNQKLWSSGVHWAGVGRDPSRGAHPIRTPPISRIICGFLQPSPPLPHQHQHQHPHNN